MAKALDWRKAAFSAKMRRNAIQPHEDLLPRDRSKPTVSAGAPASSPSGKAIPRKARRTRLKAEIAAWEDELTQALKDMRRLADVNPDDPEIGNFRRRIRRIEAMIDPLPAHKRARQKAQRQRPAGLSKSARRRQKKPGVQGAPPS